MPVVGLVAVVRGGDTPRTATLTAIEPCQVLVIDRRDFFAFVREHPDAAIKLLRTLAQRVMKLEIKVTETKEKKRIGKWDCRKYLQQTQAAMMSGTSEVWATEDLKMDYDLFAKLSAAFMAAQPGFGGSLDDAAKELKKIKGVPVLSITTMQAMNQTMKSSQELVEFKKGKAPAGIFELPKGYRKQESGSPPPTQLRPPGPGKGY